ncbi:hypothetical protein HETIRDRAFT_224390, partial [Heterobasidion irregulare TC 32-1]
MDLVFSEPHPVIVPSLMCGHSNCPCGHSLAAMSYITCLGAYVQYSSMCSMSLLGWPQLLHCVQCLYYG